jgi:ubiquinone/menaquinone biosynthesis C-methylase UbiE
MHVLDLGTGSGIFSRQLRPFVGEVTAVHPSASMRESFRSADADMEMIDGNDVSIPIDNDSVDAVFVAQAFHWFDASRALKEIHRVLVPRGGLGLIWNERDETVEWVSALSRAMQWDTRQPYEVGKDFTDVITSGPLPRSSGSYSSTRSCSRARASCSACSLRVTSRPWNKRSAIS